MPDDEGSSLRQSLFDSVKELGGEDAGETGGNLRELSPMEGKDVVSGNEVPGQTEKFQPGESVLQGTIPENKPVEAKTEETRDAEQKTEKAEAVVDAPTAWNLEDQERFRKLGDDDRKWILDKVNESEAWKGEKAKLEQEVGSYRATAGKWGPYLKGADPMQAFDYLMGVNATLTAGTPEEKINMFRVFAANNGIDLNSLASPAPQAQAPASEFADPDEEARFQAYVKPLQDRLAQFESQQVNSQQSYEMQQINEGMRILENFANEKDEAGNPKHPYYREVQNEMAALNDTYQRTGQYLGLEDLYSAAVRANPQVWAKEEARIRFNAEAAVKKEEQAKLEKARLAGSQVSSSGAGGVTSNPTENQSIRDILNAELSAQGGRSA